MRGFVWDPPLCAPLISCSRQAGRPSQPAAGSRGSEPAIRRREESAGKPSFIQVKVDRDHLRAARRVKETGGREKRRPGSDVTDLFPAGRE